MTEQQPAACMLDISYSGMERNMLLKVSDRAALWFWLPLVASAPPPISQELGNQCTLTLLPSMTTITCPVARVTCLSTHPWLILTLPCTLLGPASWPGSCGWWWGSRRLMSRSRSRSTAAVKPRAAITSLSFNFMASGEPGPASAHVRCQPIIVPASPHVATLGVAPTLTTCSRL